MWGHDESRLCVFQFYVCVDVWLSTLHTWSFGGGVREVLFSFHPLCPSFLPSSPSWFFFSSSFLLLLFPLCNLLSSCYCCCYIAAVVSDSVRPHRWQPTRLPHPCDSPGKNAGVGCHFLLQCMKVKSEGEVAQSCPTPSDPMDCSPPGSPISGILQARTLEWVAISFSNITNQNA